MAWLAVCTGRRDAGDSGRLDAGNLEGEHGTGRDQRGGVDRGRLGAAGLWTGPADSVETITKLTNPARQSPSAGPLGRTPSAAC